MIDVSSQKTKSVQIESAHTRPTMAVLKARRVVANLPSTGGAGAEVAGGIGEHAHPDARHDHGHQRRQRADGEREARDRGPRPRPHSPAPACSRRVVGSPRSSWQRTGSPPRANTHGRVGRRWPPAGSTRPHAAREAARSSTALTPLVFLAWSCHLRGSNARRGAGMTRWHQPRNWNRRATNYRTRPATRLIGPVHDVAHRVRQRARLRGEQVDHDRQTTARVVAQVESSAARLGQGLGDGESQSGPLGAAIPLPEALRAPGPWTRRRGPVPGRPPGRSWCHRSGRSPR